MKTELSITVKPEEEKNQAIIDAKILEQLAQKNISAKKDEIISMENIPVIVARGRKGGSNVAAAVCNALIYSLVSRE